MTPPQPFNQGSGRRRSVRRTGGEKRAFSERHGTLLRRAVLPVFARLNPGDVTIRHHLTGDPFRLHSFRHRGYWFHGARREAETVAFYSRMVRTTDTVVEVGAHIGYQTLVFARAAAQGRVVAFEPGPNNLPYLRRNVALRSNVDVRAQAITDRTGPVILWCEDFTGQNNSLVAPEDFQPSQLRSVSRYQVEVEGLTLDEVGCELGAVALVKVDVEAAENRVVAGGMGLLAAHRPGLMIELSPPNATAVHGTLADLGYRAFRPSGAPIRAASDIGFNTFFLHPANHGKLIAELDETA